MYNHSFDDKELFKNEFSITAISSKIAVTDNRSICSNIGGQYYEIFTFLGIALRLKKYLIYFSAYFKNQRTSCHSSAWRPVQPFSNIKVAPHVTSAENTSALRITPAPSQVGVDQVRQDSSLCE